MESVSRLDKTPISSPSLKLLNVKLPLSLTHHRAIYIRKDGEDTIDDERKMEERKEEWEIWWFIYFFPLCPWYAGASSQAQIDAAEYCLKRE